MIAHTDEQLLSKRNERLVVQHSLGEKLIGDLQIPQRIHVLFVQDLQDNFSGSATCGHKTQIGKEQRRGKLNTV